MIDRFMKFVRQTDGCWMWSGTKNKKGYGHFRVGGKTLRANRVSYSLHKGAIPNGMLVCHTCDNPTCVNPEHLFVGTSFDNMRDMALKKRNRQPKGEAHNKAKLTNEDVVLIREAVKQGFEYRTIARAFDVTPTTVFDIATRKTWKHIYGTDTAEQPPIPPA